MLKDWTNREVTVVAVLVTALSLATGLASRSVGWGIVCLLVLVALAILVQPWIAERWNAVRKRAKAKRAAVEEATERERLLPILAAWDRFHPAAGEVLRLFYGLRGVGRRTEPLSAEEWHAFSEATQRALSLAEGLYEPTKGGALRLLRPFAEIDQDDLDQCSVAAADLGNWLIERYRNHLHARSAVGLPPPPGE